MNRMKLALLFPAVIVALWFVVLVIIPGPASPDFRTFRSGDREVEVHAGPGGRLDSVDVDFRVRVPWLIDPVSFDPASTEAGEVVGVVTAPGSAGEVVATDGDGAVVQLGEGEAVEGLVLTLDGEPIAGARVVHPHQAPHLLETRTDEEGRFRFERIVSDGWIRAEADGFSPLDLPLSLFPEVGRDVVFYLVRGRRVSGQVVDSEGRGVPRAVISLDQESVSRILADDDGRFTFNAVLPDWEVLLKAHAKGLVGPVVNALVGETDIELPLYRPAEIRGRVIDGGGGEPVGEFELRRIDGEVLERGNFVARGLVPGEHRIEVRAGGDRGEAIVDVREGEVRRDVVLTVRPPRWTAPKDYRLAHPVQFVVTAEPGGGPAREVLIRGERRGQKLKADRRGRATVRLPPGEHRIRVGSAIGEFAEKVVVVHSPGARPIHVGVKRNPLAWIDFLGKVPGARSKLWLRAGDEMREVEFRGGARFSFHADREVPISVYVKARGFLPVSREDVFVPESGTVEVDLPLGVFIRGRCLGAGGHPLAKVVAEVREKPLDARMETQGDGIFKAGALKPGSYRFLLYARNVRTRTIDLDVTGEGVDLGDVRMLPPCDLHILVVTSTGAPVRHALVETSILVAAKGATDAAGRVILPGTNPEEILRISAPGFIDTWHEITVPDSTRAMEVTAILYRPARVTLRTVDGEGRPVEIAESDGPDLHRVGPGAYEVRDLPPGPLQISLTGREGREGLLQTIVLEGEERMETVTLR